MLSEFVFHGVPQGHDTWGSAGDRYYESFYGIGDSCKGAKTVLVVEVRRDANGLCSYYTYVRPQNIVAKGGRTGSYFGMSYKVSSNFCTDVYSLYRLFDMIYEEKIMGTIIEKAGNTEKYLIASFADAEHQLSLIRQLADNLIQANFENDFEEIDSSFSKQYASTSVYYNLDDVNSETFFNSTKVYGKVFVSPEYASKDSIISTLSSSDKRYQALKADYEKQIADLQQANAQIPQLKSQLSSLETEYADARKKLQEFQTAYETAKNSKATLEQQLKRSQQETEQLRKSANVGIVADRLEPSLNELLGIMRSVKPSGGVEPDYIQQWENTRHKHHSSSRGHHTYGLGPLGYILIALLVIMALFAVFFFLGRKTARREKAAIEQQYNALNDKYSSLLAEVTTLRENRSFYSLRAKSEKYPTVSFEVRDESDAIVSEALQIGKKYTVTCRGVDKKGEWKADGFTIRGKNDNPVQVEVNKADKAVLSYCVNKENALSIEYQVRQ